MKITSYFLLLLLVLLPEIGKSQSGFEFGPRIGTSYSSFLTSRGSVSAGLGLIAGGFATYALGESFLVIANLDYHQIRGGTQYAGANNGTFTLTTNSMTIHAAEAAGLVGYRLPVAILGSANLRVLAGASAAYNFQTNNTRKSNINGSLLSITNQEVVTASVAAWLYAVQGGIQFEFPLDNRPFSAAVFDFRYRRNINPLLNGLSAQGTGSAADINAESFMVTFGVKLKK